MDSPNRAQPNPAAASETDQAVSPDLAEAQATASATAPSAKIIEFPRSWIPPVRPADELAEPVITSPRILEVPEFVPPLPALGGITIEPAKQLEIERRPGIDFPLQSASLARRIFAAAIDGIVIGLAGFAFAFIFLENDRTPAASTAVGRNGGRLWSSLLGGLPIFVDRLFGLDTGASPRPAGTYSFRWKRCESPVTALARSGIVSVGNFSRSGIRLGFSRRRCPMLARPHYAHVFSTQDVRWRRPSSANR